MSSAIVAKLRKGREVRIDLDKPKGNGQFFVVALRPTDIEMSEIYALKGAHQVRRTLECVVGWGGVTEDDLIGGANMDEVPFDANLWAAWAADNASLWTPISERLAEAYAAHIESLGAAAKN